MFRIEYEPLEKDFGWIHIMINNSDLSSYYIGKEHYYGICRLNTIHQWFSLNLNNILLDDDFPVETSGESGTEMWLNSDKYIPDDFEQSIIFHEKRQSWFGHHSIYICKQEFCMPFVVFRKVEDCVEISWDNLAFHYKGVNFEYTKGVRYINIDEYVSAVKQFLAQNST